MYLKRAPVVLLSVEVIDTSVSENKSRPPKIERGVPKRNRVQIREAIPIGFCVTFDHSRLLRRT